MTPNLPNEIELTDSQKEAGLLHAGWKRVLKKMWKSPGGKLYGNLRSAWAAAKQALQGPPALTRSAERAPAGTVCASREADIVCGEPREAHTIEAARGDVGMDHEFIPATWDDEEPMPSGATA